MIAKLVIYTRCSCSKKRPTQRELDRWESARLLEIDVRFGGFPFPSPFLHSRAPRGHNANRWCRAHQLEKLFGEIGM
jgi:hypothetical protein